MSSPALDDRTFESAESVELTPEQKESILQHFRDKGYDVEIENDGAEPSADPAEQAAREDPVAPVAPPAAEQPPAATPVAAPAPQAGATDPDIDDEIRQEFQTEQATQPDGEKLSRWAKRSKQLRETKQELAQKDGTIAELRRQLAERGQATAQPATAQPTLAQPAPAQEAPKADLEAKPFDKPRPTRPKFEDFQSADEPIAAHADAVAEWQEKLIEHKEEQRKHDEAEARRIEQVRTAQNEAANWRTRRLTEARTAHPDFDAVTGHVKYEPVLTYLLTDRGGVSDGFELGYELAKPENQQFLRELQAKVAIAPDEAPSSIQQKILTAREELAVFRYNVGTKRSAPAAVAQQPPAAAAAPVTPPAAQAPPVTAAPPRREEAAPMPVRGRGATGDRLEDIPLEDSDARRAWKKRNGMM